MGRPVDDDAQFGGARNVGRINQLAVRKGHLDRPWLSRAVQPSLDLLDGITGDAEGAVAHEVDMDIDTRGIAELETLSELSGLHADLAELAFSRVVAHGCEYGAVCALVGS